MYSLVQSGRPEHSPARAQPRMPRAADTRSVAWPERYRNPSAAYIATIPTASARVAILSVPRHHRHTRRQIRAFAANSRAQSALRTLTPLASHRTAKNPDMQNLSCPHLTPHDRRDPPMLSIQGSDNLDGQPTTRAEKTLATLGQFAGNAVFGTGARTRTAFMNATAAAAQPPESARATLPATASRPRLASPSCERRSARSRQFTVSACTGDISHAARQQNRAIHGRKPHSNRRVDRSYEPFRRYPLYDKGRPACAR